MRDGTNFLPMVYTICFDTRTGESVNLADVLPKDIDYTKAWINSPSEITGDGELRVGEQLPSGYVPAAGSVINSAWIDFTTPFIIITEPGGRELRVSFITGSF
jgi:hypothetical protein